MLQVYGGRRGGRLLAATFPRGGSDWLDLMQIKPEGTCRRFL